MKYHEALTSLEQASGEDLSAFRVADGELHPKVLSWTPASFRSPGRKTMSKKRCCDDHVMRQKIDGVVKYFEYRQPQPKAAKYGF